MKKINYFLLFLFILGACHKTTIGYLVVEYGSYSPNSMEIRKELDDDPGEPNFEFEMYLDWGFEPWEIIDMGVPERINTGLDYYNVKYGIPFTSLPIEGVQGTSPISITVANVKATDGGEAAKIMPEVSVRGDGTIVVPLVNNIPKGTYLISLNFRNEGYSKVLEDCFTIIVK